MFIKSWKYLSLYSSIMPLDWHPYDYTIPFFGNGVIILFKSIIGRVLSPTFKNLTIHIIIWIIRLNQQSHMTTCSFTMNIRHWTIAIHHYLSWGPFLLLKPNTSFAFLILENLAMKYMPPLVLALLLSLGFTQSINLHFKSLCGCPTKLSPTNTCHVIHLIHTEKVKNAAQVTKPLQDIINQPLSTKTV